MRVLIVDDQAVNRQQLSQMVTEFGYRVLTVNNAQQAIEIFPDFAPDIVLLDVLMPGKKGGEVAPVLKELAGQVHLPILFITALDDKRTLLRCLESGGDDFISKPFDPVVLSAKLKAHMRTRKLSQSLEEKNRSLAYHSSRMEREYRIVRHIFRNALDRDLSDYPHLNTLFMPLSVFNGDVLLTARGPLGNLYIFMGDFTGHGLAAAIGTLPASQTFYAMTAHGAPVSEIVREMNKRLTQLLPEDMFCAAILLELSSSGERISYWNGGMTPPSLIAPDGGYVMELQPQHVALGILEPEVFDAGIDSLSVPFGSRVVLLTDGLSELEPTEGKMLTSQGVLEILADHGWDFSKASAFVRSLVEHVQQRDDITLAVLECVPTGLKQVEDSEALSTMPFSVSTELRGEEVRKHDPVARLLRALSPIEGFKPHSFALFTLLSETYNNAIDHGLLRMDSSLKQSFDGFERYYHERDRRLAELSEGAVRIEMEYVPAESRLYVTVKDSGEGFNPSQVAQRDGEFSFGRGLSLVQELAESVHWEDEGRCIRFVYAFNSVTEMTH
ncbi:MAG: fused response regulator/phosphatase [Idiomarina sp.]|nr:fused response regulator/phosphatase [Idiomarina sp.]